MESGNSANHEQNEKFNKDIKIIKKNQTEILELKNTMNEMKKKKKCDGEHQQQNGSSKERICELEDRNFKITQSEESKEEGIKKSEESLLDLWDPKRNNLQIIQVPKEERENGAQILINNG